MEFDYIVVGAGSAGCVLAKRLTDAGNSVLLLEAGGRDNYRWIHIPMGYLYCINNPRTDWQFVTTPQLGLNGRSITYPRGRVLGGSSSINGMLYIRGQAADYDGWRQMGLYGWGWDDVLPYFKKSEDHVDGRSEFHGEGGEWRVEKQRMRWQILDDWINAAVSAGIQRTDDFNTGDNEGVSYFSVNQRSGWRVNTSRAFLHTVSNKHKLRIITDAHATRILVNQNRAFGIQFLQSGYTKTASARAEVLISAGAIGSPHLLQLSGLGPYEKLKSHGIEVLRNVEEVGSNLQDHLQLRCFWKLRNAKTLNNTVNSFYGKFKAGLQYLISRTGPMSMAPSHLGAFAKSRPDVATADLEYHVQPLSLDSFGKPLHKYPAITASVCHLRPESRGTVSLRSSDPLVKPLICPNYLSSPSDQKVAIHAIRLTRKIMSQGSLEKYSPEEISPGIKFQNDEELIQASGDIGTTIFHPTSTVRMGIDEQAPLDYQMRFKGVDGLRIVDASAMPSIISGNTNSPTLMMAEKAAGYILAKST